MNFSEMSFFPPDREHELTYFTKATIVTNAVMFLISIFFDKYSNAIDFNQFSRYFLTSFLAFIVCTVSIYLHYLFINEKRGQSIFYIYCATSIGFLCPIFESGNIVKYVLIAVALFCVFITCLSSINTEKFNAFFVNYILVLIVICLVISLAIRHKFSIRGNYSFFICTLILGKIFQYLIKKGFPLLTVYPIRAKFYIIIFFASAVISLQTFFSWLPINPSLWNLQRLPYRYITINLLSHLYMVLINNSIKIRNDLNAANYESTRSC
jgi:hypothetical protein